MLINNAGIMATPLDATLADMSLSFLQIISVISN